MKTTIWLGLATACLASTSPLAAQVDGPAELKQQLEELRRIQRQQAEQIEALKKQIEILKSPAPVYPGAKSVTLEPQVEALQQRVDALTESSKKSFAAQFNPALGFVGETVFGYRGTGSEKNGSARPGGFDVNLRSAELTLQAAIDPFAKGYLVVNGSADSRGEATLGIEEAAVITTALPGNLTVRAGRFFADFGRLGYVHDHDKPFVLPPLVLARYIGGETRTDGAQIGYLFPTDQYISMTAGVGTQFGGDGGPNNVGGFRSLNELNYWSRLSTYFDFTANCD